MSRLFNPRILLLRRRLVRIPPPDPNPLVPDGLVLYAPLYNAEDRSYPTGAPCLQTYPPEHCTPDYTLSDPTRYQYALRPVNASPMDYKTDQVAGAGVVPYLQLGGNASVAADSFNWGWDGTQQGYDWAGTFTFSCLVYPTAAGYILCTANGTGTFKLQLQENGTINVAVGPSPTPEIGGRFVSSSALSFNTWHHIALRTGGLVMNGLELCIDGAVDSNGQFVNSSSMLYGFSMGGSSSLPGMAGKLSSVRVYNRGLTDSELLTLANEFHVVTAASE